MYAFTSYACVCVERMQTKYFPAPKGQKYDLLPNQVCSHNSYSKERAAALLTCCLVPAWSPQSCKSYCARQAVPLIKISGIVQSKHRVHGSSKALFVLRLSIVLTQNSPQYVEEFTVFI